MASSDRTCAVEFSFAAAVAFGAVERAAGTLKGLQVRDPGKLANRCSGHIYLTTGAGASSRGETVTVAVLRRRAEPEPGTDASTAKRIAGSAAAHRKNAEQIISAP
jgi:hypothetical protein